MTEQTNAASFLRRFGVWPLAGLAIAVLVGLVWWNSASSEEGEPLSVGMTFEFVVLEPQPPITGTFNGDCYLSEIKAGGHVWKESYDRFRSESLTGWLTVTEVRDYYAFAKFTSDGGDAGEFITTWKDKFVPRSDPCGI